MIKIVPKIMMILEILAVNEEYSFQEITDKTGLNKSTLSHILHSLCECGFLKKTKRGKYVRGERLVHLCMGRNPWKRLTEIAERCASNIVAELHALAVIGVRYNNQRLTIVKQRPEKKNSLTADEQRSYPAGWYCNANGRILLAFASEENLNQIILRDGLPERAVWREAVSKPKLVKELAKIRAQKYVVMDVDDDFRAIGVPVLDAAGKYLLSLSTALPLTFRKYSTEEIIRKLQFFASIMEEELSISGISVSELLFQNPEIQ